MSFDIKTVPGVNAAPKELREFGLITGSIFALLFGMLLPWLKARPFPFWPWILCAILVGGGVLAPRFLRLAYIVWSSFGRAIGWVNQRIILMIVFYLVVAPMGMVMRLFRSDPMARGLDPQKDSYRVTSRRAPIKSFERPF